MVWKEGKMLDEMNELDGRHTRHKNRETSPGRV